MRFRVLLAFVLAACAARGAPPPPPPRAERPPAPVPPKEPEAPLPVTPPSLLPARSEHLPPYERADARAAA